MMYWCAQQNSSSTVEWSSALWLNAQSSLHVGPLTLLLRFFRISCTSCSYIVVQQLARFRVTWHVAMRSRASYFHTCLVSFRFYVSGALLWFSWLAGLQRNSFTCHSRACLAILLSLIPATLLTCYVLCLLGLRMGERRTLYVDLHVDMTAHYPRDAMLRPVLFMALCPCLSASVCVCHKSVFYRKGRTV